MKTEASILQDETFCRRKFCLLLFGTSARPAGTPRWHGNVTGEETIVALPGLEPKPLAVHETTELLSHMADL